MKGIQFTYDSRQDRILLQSGMDIAMPDWWLTRREVKRLLKAISAVTTSQYEVDKVLNTLQLDATGGDASVQATVASSYRDFHRSQVGNTKTEVNQSSWVNDSPAYYPLAAYTKIDLNADQGIKLFVLDEDQQGVCLEFTQPGLYRLNNMLFTVAQKAQWI